MSRLVARLLLSFLMIPVGGLVYLTTCVVGFDVMNWPRAAEKVFTLAGAATWLAMGAYWLALWYRTVRWTTSRVVNTVAAALGSMVVGALAGAAVYAFVDDFAVFLGTAVAPLVWLICTVLIWRETPAERRERLRASGRDNVVCPTCGYTLTGLTATRCPECGSQFTLDELLASQPSRADAEVE